ncbi:MAG: hypothetical protein R2825_22520 [Saprospiraceae bacterium]
MNQTIFTLCFLLFAKLSFSQVDRPAFTPAVERLKNVETRKSLLENSLVKNIPFKSIGPTIFSGRVADVDVWQKDPTHFYVAYASGGLWKTDNNGQSFTPLFDHETVMSWATSPWIGTATSSGRTPAKLILRRRATLESGCSKVWMEEKHGNTRACQRAITLAV